MANILFICINWLTLLFFTSFIFDNITNIAEGGNWYLLFFAVGLAFFSLVWKFVPSSKIAIRRSAIYLVAFLAYFIVKLLIDVEDLGEIKAFTIGTSGGLIFALGFGVIVSLILSDLHFRFGKDNRALKIGFFIGFLYLTVSFFIGIHAFVSHISNVRMDYFLINNDAGLYQRPGCFISMNFVLLSAVLSLIVTTYQTLKKLYRRVILGCYIVVYVFNALLSVMLAQLIGSNSGFAFVAFVFVITLVYIVLYTRTGHWSNGMGFRYGIGAIFLGKIGRELLVTIVGTLLVFSFAAWFLLWYFEIDLSLFRISGFGESNFFMNRSLTSRAEFFAANFMTHFGYNPIFGNLRVDNLTTGAGTYVHSLFSIITHLGILGFILFCLFLFQTYRELVYLRPAMGILYYDNAFGFYRLLCLGVVLIMASISAFFTWIPLWFAFGLLVPPCIIKETVHQKGVYLKTRRAEFHGLARG